MPESVTKDDLERAVERVVERLTGLMDDKIERLIGLMQVNFARIDQRFDEVNSRFNEVNARFDTQALRSDRQAALIQVGGRWTGKINEWSEKVDSDLQEKARQIGELSERIRKLEKDRG